MFEGRAAGTWWDKPVPKLCPLQASGWCVTTPCNSPATVRKTGLKIKGLFPCQSIDCQEGGKASCLEPTRIGNDGGGAGTGVG